MTKPLGDDQEDLLAKARVARDTAYAPYSRFQVGAAVRGGSGTIYTGCNIENASYSLSICAERVAVFKAVAAGERTLTALAVCTDATDPAMPCGACRQVLVQFGRDIEIVLGNLAGNARTTSIGALLPEPFVFDP